MLPILRLSFLSPWLVSLPGWLFDLSKGLKMTIRVKMDDYQLNTVEETVEYPEAFSDV